MHYYKNESIIRVQKDNFTNGYFHIYEKTQLVYIKEPISQWVLFAYMEEKVMKKRVIATSLMSIAMLASIATGATYALFTKAQKNNGELADYESRISAIMSISS